MKNKIIISLGLLFILCANAMLYTTKYRVINKDNTQNYMKYLAYYKKFKEDYSSVDISEIDIKILPSPYCDLKTILNFTYSNTYLNSEYIKKLFIFNNISSAIEIGSYFGASTRHMASLISDEGKLYAIDIWEPSLLYQELNPYERFLSNMIISGLAHKVIPIRERSDKAIQFFKELDKKFDLIYVDGDHDTEPVLSDLENYFPLLSSNGIMCGDDWVMTTVRIAVLQFAEKYNLTVYGDCNFWFLKKEDCGYCYKSFLTAPDSAWKFGSK